jgi:hypothetical protein
MQGFIFAPTEAIVEAKSGMWDLLVNGGFVILGAIIAAAAGYWGALAGARVQVKAIEDQGEDNRRRFQQTRHQKKYAMALALRLEAQRIGVAAEKRISVLQASRTGASRHPERDQLTISVLPLIRGEREDIGLLGDELQDSALNLAKTVDDYIAHIETIQRTAGGPISVDAAALQKLEGLHQLAVTVDLAFSEFIAKVREWRCKRCEAFIDEVLDVTQDGGRMKCPVCNNTTRIAQASATMLTNTQTTVEATVIRRGAGQ